MGPPPGQQPQPQPLLFWVCLLYTSLARQDIEKFMGTKVYLETWVKVKENWRDNVNFIRSQGYNEQ